MIRHGSRRGTFDEAFVAAVFSAAGFSPEFFLPSASAAVVTLEN